VIDVIIAPESVQQIHTPPQQPCARLDQLDHKIVGEFRRHGLYGAPLWTPLNTLAESSRPKDRNELRRTRLELWRRLRGLLRAGVLHRWGRNHVTATKVHRERSARAKRCADAGSTFPQVGETGTTPAVNQFCFILLGQPSPAPTLAVESRKTKTAPEPAQVTAAARSLALLPRHPRRQWSGLIDRVRSFRNMLIRLPDGRVVYALGARRGRVVFTSQADGPIGSLDGVGRDWGATSADLVAVVKNPMAAILGSRKRGMKEAPSARKQAAARANGRCPVRAGRRPRGRPRRHLS
jgi:hypothetical protein